MRVLLLLPLLAACSFEIVAARPGERLAPSPDAGALVDAAALDDVDAAPLADTCGDGTCTIAEACDSCPVDCALCDTVSVFGAASAPDREVDDGESVELGVKLRVSQPGLVRALRWYRTPSAVGALEGHLWSGAGQLLATTTFVDDGTDGWIEAPLTAPVRLQPGTTYVVSIFVVQGRYGVSNFFFDQAVASGPLRALASGEDGGNGVFSYAAASAFPVQTYQDTNYWLDVAFSSFAP